MKKLISVMVVLLVATALFAGLKFKTGGAFAFVNQDIYKAEDSWFKNGIAFRAEGFGVEVGAYQDVSSNLMLYGQANMVFPRDGLMMKKDLDTDWTKVSISEKYSITLYHFAAGIAYNFDFIETKVALGIGPVFNSSVVKFTVPEDVYTTEKATLKAVTSNIGIGAFIDLRYVLNKKFEFGFTATPMIGIYNIAKVVLRNDKGINITSEALENKGVSSAKAKGFIKSFSVPVSFGFTYAF